MSKLVSLKIEAGPGWDKGYCEYVCDAMQTSVEHHDTCITIDFHHVNLVC